MQVNTLKYRFGRLWNKKLAYFMKAPYLPGDAPARDMKCPLCGLDDAAGHILGGCKHKEMSAMYIARHDKAMRKVIQEVIRGEYGNYYIIADVGTPDGLKEMGVHSKRIPAFVLPDEYIANNRYDDDEEQYPGGLARDKMQPDIMIVEMDVMERDQHTEPLPPHMPDGNARKVWLVEGGYCADTKYEKKKQHKTLHHMLQSYGYDVIMLPIILGFSGTIYKSTLECMHKLGVEKMRSTKLLSALHLHAITSLHSTVKLRRRLERNCKNKTRNFPSRKFERAKPP